MNIKELRKETGLTQKEFAGKYGCSVSSVANWEQDRYLPPAYYLEVLEQIIKEGNRGFPPKRKSLKTVREKAKLSRPQFEEKYGVPVRTLEDWDAGRRSAPQYIEDALVWAVERDLKR